MLKNEQSRTMESFTREIVTIQTWSYQTKVCRHLKTTFFLATSMYSKLFQASDPARLKKLTFRLQAMLGLLESGQIIPGLGTVNLHPGQDLYQASWSGWLLSEQLFWKSMNFVLLKICILLSLFLEPHMSICFYRTILPRFVPRCGFRIHPICKAICNHIYMYIQLIYTC